jgi:N utilization substance protein B
VGKRTKARECAFQILYQCEVGGDELEGVLERFWRVRAGTEAMRAMAERLARGAWRERVASDQAIDAAAEHWRLERIAAVDKSILRLGAHELSGTETPPKVVIDEAVELAKRFGERDSPAFVNGVLDAIMKRMRSASERAE